MRTPLSTRQLSLAGLLAPLFLAAPLAADTPTDGYALADLAYPGGVVTRTLSDGDVVTFDGLTVDRYNADGVFVGNLATLPASVFSSFLIVHETAERIVFGESSTGTIYRMDLAGSSPVPVTSLTFNYDAVFETADTVLVSAAALGFGFGNQVYRVDLVTGATTELVAVAGASGPVALDASGDLVLATVTDAWPPPAGSSQVLRFDAGLLTGAPVLTELDGTVLEPSLDGAASLALDASTGTLFLAENNFASGINRLRVVGGDVLVEGLTGFTLSNVEFLPGDGIGAFAAYQPETSGTLLYNTTDFATVSARRAVTPLRPALATNGLGTSGPGPFDVTLDACPPNGFGILFYDLAANAPVSGEYALNLSFPLVLGLDAGTVMRIPGTLPVDSLGASTVGYVNPGGFVGTLQLQAILFDVTGALVASSNVSAF